MRILLSLCLIAFSCAEARAALLDVTLTGADLLTNPNVTLNETATLGPGTSIQFLNDGPNTGAPREFLFTFDFLGAGSRGNLPLIVDVNFTLLDDDNGSADSDLAFGVHDGTNIAAIERSDNESGRWLRVEGPVSGILTPAASLPAIVAGLGTLEQNTMSYTLLNGGATTGLVMSEGVISSSSISYSTTPLNSDNALTFFMGRGGRTENYQIDSIRIRAVPEPSGLAFLGATFGFVFGPWRSRRAF